MLIEDEALLKDIKDVLSMDSSIDDLKVRLNVPILILHQSEITDKSKEWSEEYKVEIADFHKKRATEYFSSQINRISKKIHLYEKIKFHLILVPVPNKESIIDLFEEKINFIRGEG